MNILEIPETIKKAQVETMTDNENYFRFMDHNRNTPLTEEGGEKDPKTDIEITQCAKFLSTDPLNLNLTGSIFCVWQLWYPQNPAEI